MCDIIILQLLEYMFCLYIRCSHPGVFTQVRFIDLKIQAVMEVYKDRRLSFPLSWTLTLVSDTVLNACCLVIVKVQRNVLVEGNIVFC